MKNYKNCDELTEEISELCKKRRENENELALLAKKAKKSKIYMSKNHYSSSDDYSVRSKPIHAQARSDKQTTISQLQL